MSFRFIHIVIYNRLPSFESWVIVVCVCDMFFTHSSIPEHLGYFHISTIMNNAAMNTGTHIPLQYPDFNFFKCITRCGIYTQIRVVLFLAFWDPFLLFSIADKQICTPDCSVQWFQSLHNLSSIYYLFVCFLIIVILMGVGWYFPVGQIFISLVISDVEHLFIRMLTICLFS